MGRSQSLSSMPKAEGHRRHSTWPLRYQKPLSISAGEVQDTADCLLGTLKGFTTCISLSL